jgi:hypothetical protein
LFLPSYPTVESGPLHGAAYLYDNAVAAIALVAVSETKHVGSARRFCRPSITTAPGMMDGSGTLTPRVWLRMAPPNFRVGGTPPRLAFLQSAQAIRAGVDMATAAEHFVDTMWDPACACFAAGTAEDGVTHNPTLAWMLKSGP